MRLPFSLEVSATRLAAALLVAGSLLPGSWPRSLEAQEHGCSLRVQPQSGDAGYRSRGQRCEGMYVGLQSAPLSVQVISLVKGGLSYEDADRMLYVHVPSLAGLPDSLLLLGQSREANLHWALDASVPPGNFLTWDLGEVIVPVGLSSQRIGIAAQAPGPASGHGGPLYVPVDVSPRLQLDTARDSLELIVRVPGAAALRWSFDGAEPFTMAERLNVDGYFRIMVPPLPSDEAPGETPLAIFWRPRYQEWVDAPVQIRIYRW